MIMVYDAASLGTLDNEISINSISVLDSIVPFTGGASPLATR